MSEATHEKVGVTMARITTPFGATSTAAEVIAGVDLTGRRAVVTGGASGIGLETTRALASAGAEVTLAVRDVAAGQSAADGISATTGHDRLVVAPLDLADRESIGAFVDSLARPAGHPRRQRRHHGDPGIANSARVGAPVRHQPPRALRLDHGSA